MALDLLEYGHRAAPARLRRPGPGHHLRKGDGVTQRIPRTVEGLLAHTKPHPGSECRDWAGAKTNGGYGALDGTTAHRVMYTLAVGPIPAGWTVDHLKKRGCVSTLCIRPPHLEAVTPRAN